MRKAVEKLLNHAAAACKLLLSASDLCTGDQKLSEEEQSIVCEGARTALGKNAVRMSELREQGLDERFEADDALMLEYIQQLMVAAFQTVAVTPETRKQIEHLRHLVEQCPNRMKPGIADGHRG